MARENHPIPASLQEGPMCHQSSCASVSFEEVGAAEQCLIVYCKPVELYNILQRRAQYNPPFLQRCLRYKLQAKKRRRVSDGYVIFNYKDQNDMMRKSEVTREFTCPFCLTRCGSFKGIRYHLTSFHDLFSFEFWDNEEYRAVNVSVRVDALQLENMFMAIPSEFYVHSVACSVLQIIANGVDTRMQSFCFCSKPRKRSRAVDPFEKSRYVHPQILEPDWDGNALEGAPKKSHETEEGEDVPISTQINSELSNSRIRGEMNRSGNDGAKSGEHGSNDPCSLGVPVARAQSFEEIECCQNAFDQRTLLSLPSSSKARKLPLDRADSRNGALLHKRPFFHSHRAQPMAMDQVLSDKDSEDEVDDDVADLEDRRMLDDFVDVSKDEKHVMHLWNSFIRRQRVLADGHVPWACEAFLRVHGPQLVENPALLCCWRLFTVKLWNHGLIDGSTISNCGSILEGLSHEDLSKITKI